MFARNVTLKLKPNSAIEFSRLFDSHVLPVLREQPGFKDGLTLVSGERSEAVAISFWDNRENADAFNNASYAPLVAKLSSVLAEEPCVSTMVVSNSTPHSVSTR